MGLTFRASASASTLASTPAPAPAPAPLPVFGEVRRGVGQPRRRRAWHADAVQKPAPVTPDAPGRIVFPLLTQQWLDLCFLHWAVAPETVAGLLPRGTVPDTHDGVSYVGLVAFRIHRVGWFRLPGVPYLGSFPETNVRLYSVDAHGRRGVVVRSMDATRLIPVAMGRAGFRLPYLWSRMSVGADGDTVTYTSRRRRPGPRGAYSRIGGAPRRAHRGADRPRVLPHRPLGDAQRLFRRGRLSPRPPSTLAPAPRRTDRARRT